VRRGVLVLVHRIHCGADVQEHLCALERLLTRRADG
jgi:hypothetical protein